MKTEPTSTVACSSSGFGSLALVFIVLKLCGVITWSWWWVLSPIWIYWGIAACIILTAVIIATLCAFFGDVW